MPAAAAPEAGARRLRALLNREGGTVLRLGVDAVRTELEGGFGRGEAIADLRFLPPGELHAGLAAALSDARAGRLDGVVVGGGDGSVNTAAALLAGTGVPLGVLPIGTLNHFAKDVGMPPDLAEAAAAIATAEPRAVDVAEVNGRVFVNNSLLGVYPYMVADRERRRRLHGLGKWAAMSLAFLRMLARFPRRRLTLVVGGEQRRYRTPCLFIGVNEYEVERFNLQRRGGMAGGRLWLLVAKHSSPLRFAWFACRTAYRGLDPARGEDFELMEAKAVEVHLAASRIPVSTDGEIQRMRGPLRYRIRPGDLLVLAPPA